MRKQVPLCRSQSRMHIPTRASEARAVTSPVRGDFPRRGARIDVLVEIGMVGDLIFLQDGKLRSVGLYQLLE